MNNMTEIICIIDKSGSMGSLKSDTLGGYNSFIESQQKLDCKSKITTILFNSSTQILNDGVDIQECELLNNSNYITQGGTALLDAIGDAIDNMNKRLVKTPKADRPSKIVCVIITDGEENQSRQYTKDKINCMIEFQRELLDWEFLFLGANQDAIQAGSNLGIRTDRSVTFSANSRGVDSVYENLSKTITNFTTQGVIEDNWSSNIK
jgi:Mg-chelatase subunit ChlD